MRIYLDLSRSKRSDYLWSSSISELKAYKAKVKRQLDEWLNNHPAEDSQNPNTDTTVQDLIKYHEGKSPNDIKKSVEDVIESTVESYLKFNSNRGIVTDKMYIEDWKTARKAEIDAWYKRRTALEDPESDLKTIPFGGYIRRFIEKVRLRDSKSP